MAIRNSTEKFMHGLADIYDAEHQFLKGQEMMLQNATDPNLQQMIRQHMQQTEAQIRNLEQIFSGMGSQPQRQSCDGAKGILTESQKMMKETQDNPALLDCTIAGGASKVEHYEMATYRGLIQEAELMGQQGIVSLLQQNLEQEVSTSRLIESSMPQLLQTAMQAEGTQPSGGYSQAYPTS